MNQRHCNEPTNFDNLRKTFPFHWWCAQRCDSWRPRIDINMLNYASRWDSPVVWPVFVWHGAARSIGRKRNEKWTVSVTSKQAISVPNAEYIFIRLLWSLCPELGLRARERVCVWCVTRDSPQIIIMNKSFLLADWIFAFVVDRPISGIVCSRSRYSYSRPNEVLNSIIVCRMQRADRVEWLVRCVRTPETGTCELVIKWCAHRRQRLENKLFKFFFELTSNASHPSSHRINLCSFVRFRCFACPFAIVKHFGNGRRAQNFHMITAKQEQIALRPFSEWIIIITIKKNKEFIIAFRYLSLMIWQRVNRPDPCVHFGLHLHARTARPLASSIYVCKCARQHIFPFCLSASFSVAAADKWKSEKENLWSVTGCAVPKMKW